MKPWSLSAIILSLCLTVQNVSAQKPPVKDKPAQSTRADNSHRFYSLMYFLGEAFGDNKNPACEPGFIGWYQESPSEDPILLIPNDAFRNVQTECTPQDLKLDNISCLEKNSIQRRLVISGKVYTTKLTMTQKNGVPNFRLQRFVGEKLEKNCFYTPFNRP
jgi:hypothetical protein